MSAGFWCSAAFAQSYSFATFTFDQGHTMDNAVLQPTGTFDGAIVTSLPVSATGSVGFPAAPTAGFTNSLALGAILDGTNGPRAINLPNGNNGTAERSGVLLNYSDGMLNRLQNDAGDDFVVYESGSNGTSPEGFMVQVFNFTMSAWTPWYYEPADSFGLFNGDPTQGAFATAFDLTDLGVGAGEQITQIRIVNLTDEDRMVDASGIGEVIPEDNGSTSANLPDPGPLASFMNYGASTLDPDPLYVAALRMQVPVELESFGVE